MHAGFVNVPNSYFNNKCKILCNQESTIRSHSFYHCLVFMYTKLLQIIEIIPTELKTDCIFQKLGTLSRLASVS